MQLQYCQPSLERRSGHLEPRNPSCTGAPSESRFKGTSERAEGGIVTTAGFCQVFSKPLPGSGLGVGVRFEETARHVEEFAWPDTFDFTPAQAWCAWADDERETCLHFDAPIGVSQGVDPVPPSPGSQPSVSRCESPHATGKAGPSARSRLTLV